MNERSQLIQILERLIDRFPDERIGQLIVNVATIARPPKPIRTTEATDRELYEAAVRRELIAEPLDIVNPSPRRQAIIRLAAERWPEGLPFGQWISQVAKHTGTTLIHISDSDLRRALLSDREK